MRKILCGGLVVASVLSIWITAAHAQGDESSRRLEQEVTVIPTTKTLITKAGVRYAPIVGEGSSEPCDTFSGDEYVWKVVIEDDAESVVNIQGGISHRELNEVFSSSVEVAGDFQPQRLIIEDIEKPARSYSETGRWLACVPPDKDVLGTYLGPIYAEGGFVDTNLLTLEAIDSVSPGAPSFVVEPGVDLVYAQQPILYHIDEQYWKPYTASASAGRVTVSATMTPVRSIWDSGEDGESSITCAGPGEKYQKGRSLDSFECSHTYSWATIDDEPYQMTSTVVFEVSATSNVGPLGEFPDIALTSSEEIPVKEIQVVVVPNE